MNSINQHRSIHKQCHHCTNYFALNIIKPWWLCPLFLFRPSQIPNQSLAALESPTQLVVSSTSSSSSNCLPLNLLPGLLVNRLLDHLPTGTKEIHSPSRLTERMTLKITLKNSLLNWIMGQSTSLSTNASSIFSMDNTTPKALDINALRLLWWSQLAPTSLRCRQMPGQQCYKAMLNTYIKSITDIPIKMFNPPSLKDAMAKKLHGGGTPLNGEKLWIKFKDITKVIKNDYIMRLPQNLNLLPSGQSMWEGRNAFVMTRYKDENVSIIN